jgi:succinate-semialdehyde dehydrogenase/glutarate-semialdehyde dehydrogenase
MRHGCLVQGKRVESDRWLPLVNPATGETFASVSAAGAPEVEAALRSAEEAFDPWRALSARRRTETLHALAEAVRRDRGNLASLVSLEVGKPVHAALREVMSTATTIDYFAEENLRMAGQIPLLGNARQHVFILRQPLGVVVAITPFNYPLSTLACKLAPALAVGCAVVAKPDEHAPLAALRLAELALESGLPPGVFNVLTGSAETGKLLVDHPIPKLITFTGSTAVGKEILAISARWVRKVVLELGGNCPAILCPDAPWRELLPEFVRQSFNNAGQYCYRISRIYTPRSFHADFLREFVRLASSLRVGSPEDSATDIGPLNNSHLLSSVSRQVEGAVSAGAAVELGGTPARPSGGGFYYPPTILSGVRPEMAIMREEVFGPVTMVRPYEDVEEAVREANATPYGLAAYVFTKDTGRALDLVNRLDAGSVWINKVHQAYLEAPFGGMKESGLGREKSRFGMEEFTELKTIYLSY